MAFGKLSRVLIIVNDVTRECLAAMPAPLSVHRVARVRIRRIHPVKAA